MKWYFASRTRHQQKLVELKKHLEDVGEKVMSDWVHTEKFASYEKDTERLQVFSQEIVDALLRTDIFVLISDPEGTDMFVELGVCLAVHEIKKENKVYIVGEHAKRSLMQIHPSIVHVQNLEKVFALEGISFEDTVKLPTFE